MRVLGIETSCDETGIAIYEQGRGILSHAIYSQTDIHAKFGGVVPELASRDHVRKVMPLIEEVLNNANMTMSDITGIAYTKGPGLAGALLIGAMIGRTLGFVLNVPTVGVHHLEGHLLSPFLGLDYCLGHAMFSETSLLASKLYPIPGRDLLQTWNGQSSSQGPSLEENPPAFPFLCLLVSGGHTELIKAERVGNYQIIGETVDDAAGEAFDKTAKLLGLGYPGGALLEQLAEKGDPKRFRFPRPMIDKKGFDFSFSGLKTFALHTFNAHSKNEQTKADIARAFQDAMVDTLTIKCKRALFESKLTRLVIAGGVSANNALRQSLLEMGKANNIQLYFPRLEFCTDNGAMIAYAGFLRLSAGEKDDLSMEVYPRWPIDQLTAI